MLIYEAPERCMYAIDSWYAILKEVFKFRVQEILSARKELIDIDYAMEKCSTH